MDGRGLPSHHWLEPEELREGMATRLRFFPQDTFRLRSHPPSWGEEVASGPTQSELQGSGLS